MWLKAFKRFKSSKNCSIYLPWMGFGATRAPLFFSFSLVTPGATCASKQTADFLDLGHQKAQLINLDMCEVCTEAVHSVAI